VVISVSLRVPPGHLGRVAGSWATDGASSHGAVRFTTNVQNVVTVPVVVHEFPLSKSPPPIPSVAYVRDPPVVRKPGSPFSVPESSSNGDGSPPSAKLLRPRGIFPLADISAKRATRMRPPQLHSNSTMTAVTC
jgi:hypothetical protein